MNGQEFSEGKSEDTGIPGRARCLGILAQSEPQRLVEFVGYYDRQVPEYRVIQVAETGLMMLRGRMGGNGRPFNLGEVTVTRCSVQMGTGELGRGSVLGRNKSFAHHLALIDSLLQIEYWHLAIFKELVTPALKALQTRQERISEDAEKTKVQFMTMVRGE